MERTLYLNNLDGVVDPARQYQIVCTMLDRMSSMAGDGPVLVCSIDHGAESEFRRLEPVFDNVLGRSGYRHVNLSMARKKVPRGGYRPITSYVEDRHIEHMMLL